MDLVKEIAAREGCKRDLKKLGNNPFPPVKPLFVKIKLLWNCNLSCKFCIIPQGGTPMPLEKARKLLDELHREGVKKIHFSGGEVFMHPHIMEILRYGEDKKFQINLTTNGTLLDKAAIKELKKISVHSIILSLDGPNPKVHDPLRGGKGSFKKVYKTLERLCYYKKKKPKLRVNTVVSRENIYSLDEIHNLLLEMQTDIAWKLIPLDAERKKHFLTKEMLLYLCENIPRWKLLDNLAGYRDILRIKTDEKAVEKYKKGKYSLGYYKKNICYMPWLHLFITPDGSVYPCCMSRGKVPSTGNVFSQSLQEIIKGERMKAVRLNIAAGNPFECCSLCDDFITENRSIKRYLES